MDDHPLIAELKKQDDEHRSRIESLLANPDQRTQVYIVAGNELLAWLEQWQAKHKLTTQETLWIIQKIPQKLQDSEKKS